jgi:Domain of unknown function (DUF4440)
MPKLLVALAAVILIALTSCTQDDVARTETVDNVVAQLDAAFEAQNVNAAKALMTPDHLSVTPYYGTPQSVDEVLASLPDLKYAQTDESEPKVVLLGDDAAMRTLTAKVDGTFKGEPFSYKVFITAILVRQNGKWLERFYQVTRLAP